MFNALSFNLVPGGFQFAIAGGFDIAVAWSVVLITYIAVHLGSKLMRILPKRR